MTCLSIYKTCVHSLQPGTSVRTSTHSSQPSTSVHASEQSALIGPLAHVTWTMWSCVSYIHASALVGPPTHATWTMWSRVSCIHTSAHRDVHIGSWAYGLLSRWPRGFFPHSFFKFSFNFSPPFFLKILLNKNKIWNKINKNKNNSK